MKQRKITAMILAAALSVSVNSGMVLADGYQEVEKAKMAEAIAELIEEYKPALESYTMDSSAQADISLALGETGRALLGMLVPVDISWANNIGLDMQTTVEGSDQAILGNLYLNDTDVLTIEMIMNQETMQSCMRIPELHDSYLLVDMAMEEAEAFPMPEDPTELLPDAETLEKILTKYTDILFAGFEESVSRVETIDVEGVKMECTTMEDKRRAEDIQSVAENFLMTLQTDTDIKDLIEKWAALVPSETDAYSEFRSSINEAINEVTQNPLEDDGSYILSKIWLSKEDKIVGREIALVAEGTENVLVIRYKAPETEESSALLLEMEVDGEALVLKGNGTITDGKLSGIYTVSMNGADMIAIEVKDQFTDEATGENGGSYRLAVLEGIGAEEYESLGMFGLLLECYANQTNKQSQVYATIEMSGSPIVTIGIGGETCEALEIVDVAELENTLDTASEDDMVTYVTEMDWTPIIENFVEAGMPEELAAELDNLIYTSIYGEVE